MMYVKTRKGCIAVENHFCNTVSYNGLTIKYAQGPSMQRGNEIHTYHEIVCFLTGGNILYSEYGQWKIPAQTLLLIPKYTYHRADFEDESKYRRLVMNFSDMFAPALFQELLDDIHIFDNIPENVMQILRRMISAFEQNLPDYKCELIQYSCFIQLLVELSLQKNPRKAFPVETNPTLASIIAYIDAHLTEPLNENIIAKELFISPSTVRVTISRNLNISLHRYIVKKRLMLAQQFIEAEKPPSQVYQKCGFSDYSAFYRAYKNYFGVPPSHRCNRP